MYQSADARPGPSQTSKINIFTGVVNAFKLMLKTISKAPSWMFEGL